MAARLARIQIFPFKSLDPVVVDEANVLPSGALQHDRQFALVDEQGLFLNGKRTRLMHTIRSTVDFAERQLDLQAAGQRQSFQLERDKEALEAWFSAHVSLPVKLLENTVNGLPDDLNAPGPTILSTATLEAVASWFPGLTLDEARLRFRANLEVDGVEPFWEDTLYGEKGQSMPFQIGAVRFQGVNPCQRCAVPTRNPMTGEAIPGFIHRFTEMRKVTLPSWAAVSRFDHFYRLAVNTRLAQTDGGSIKVGDTVTY